MSQYLVARCEAHPRITVRTNAQVVRVLGEERLEALHIDVSGRIEIVDADALFILIGGVPTSAHVDWVRHDDDGFFLTGPDVLADGGRGTWWKLEREPHVSRVELTGDLLRGRRAPRLDQARRVSRWRGRRGGHASTPLPRMRRRAAPRRRLASTAIETVGIEHGRWNAWKRRALESVAESFATIAIV